MLAQTFPEIRSAKPGEIQVEDLPELRNLVLVDNEDSARDDLTQLHIKSMVDWRELLMWREGHAAAQARRDIAARLKTDDVINLQFTRYIPPHPDILCKKLALLIWNSGTTGSPKAVSVMCLWNKDLPISSCLYVSSLAYALEFTQQCSLHCSMYVFHRERYPLCVIFCFFPSTSVSS